MLIQLLTQRPDAIGTILQRTPVWVWGLLAALLALGISQLKGRQVGLRRVVIVPVAWLGFALYGIYSAFGNSGQLVAALIAWLVAAASVTAILLQSLPQGDTRFEAASQTFSVPGSVVPLLLILGIFMTKYIVGIELAMNATLAQDASFVLPIALLYGAFNGIFTARALRLLRMVGTHTIVTGKHSLARRLLAGTGGYHGRDYGGLPHPAPANRAIK